jgi:glycyl-tRNA synthetase beta chain
MTDVLLELRSEEIPARMQVKAKDDLARLFAAEIAKAGLAASAIETFATPRRLALIARGLPDATEAVSEEIKGPKAGAPPQALEGFLRKTGLTREELVERDGVLFAVIEKSGQPTADVLSAVIPAIVRGFPWPKSMRWGAASASTESLRWVRPLQGIVALFGSDVVPCAVDGIESGRATTGHRFHHSGTITIGSANDYVEKLRDAHVLVHLSERTALIRDGAARLAGAAGLSVIEDEALVVENAGLTEWPVPLLGRFDPAFLDVPPEVIQLTARVNQKYFVLRDGEGRLAPNFICTANIEASDGGAAIVAGNERVLSARLSDAKFFWENDLKVPLETQAAKLSQIVFHEKLGTVADKVERVAKLARWLCEEGIVKPAPLSPSRERATREASGERASMLADQAPLPGASRLSLPPEGEGGLAALAERAARLCKADLVTGMVGEFPELQGVIGGYLAAAQGEHPAVAAAIRDHYKPVGQGDDVPTDPVTVAVSLADKLDSLVAFFAADELPTGSKDPFALRRQGLAVISLILENLIRLPLIEAIGTHDVPGLWDKGSSSADPENLFRFLADRLKVQQREAGVRHDLIDAVFALGGEDDLVRLLARVKALQAFVTTDDGAKLLGGYKRVAQILKKEGFAEAEQSAKITLSYTCESADIALSEALDSVEPSAAAAIDAEDFEGAMTALAGLRGPIDAFFDNVEVNDDDAAVREGRLALLARVRHAVHNVADFSKIEG